MDLTFQVFMQHCSLQHRTLPPSSVTSTTGYHFHFGAASSCFGAISLLFPSSILDAYQLGRLIFQCHIFSFPSPVDNVISEPSIMTCPSWVALHSMAHSFIELDRAVEWANLTQMTIISTTVGKNLLEEME